MPERYTSEEEWVWIDYWTTPGLVKRTLYLAQGPLDGFRERVTRAGTWWRVPKRWAEEHGVQTVPEEEVPSG